LAVALVDTDGMSLLDYAGSVLGWHSHWPEVLPSAWDELAAFADFDPALSLSVAEAVTSRPEYGELQLSIFVPAPIERKARHVDYCGGCFQRFEATDAVTAAKALRHHIEAEPCAHYATAADQDALLPPALASST
jgi:hypothetical protein